MWIPWYWKEYFQLMHIIINVFHRLCLFVIITRYPNSVIIPMDGYHLYRKDLTQEGLRFRGAPWTFDILKFQQDIRQLRKSNIGYFPNFEHKIKDPIENQIQVTQDTRLVIIEGLYIYLNEWEVLIKLYFNLVYDLFDLKIFIRGDPQNCIEKLVKRHLESGICLNVDEAEQRAMESDYKNGIYLLENSEFSNVYFVDV